MADEDKPTEKKEIEYVPAIRRLFASLTEKYGNEKQSTSGKLAFNLTFYSKGKVVRPSVGIYDESSPEKYIPLVPDCFDVPDGLTPERIFQLETEHLGEYAGYLTGLINKAVVSQATTPLRFKEGELVGAIQ